MCIAIDGDTRPKASSKYCSLCGKWICADCKLSPKRVDAAFEYWKKVVKDAFLSGLGITPKSEEK